MGNFFSQIVREIKDKPGNIDAYTLTGHNSHGPTRDTFVTHYAFHFIEEIICRNPLWLIRS